MSKTLTKNLKELLVKFRYGVPIFKPRNANALLGLPYNSKLNLKYELSVSQDNQDLIALHLLKKHFPERGIDALKVVDIGANHPIRLSNTYYFEQLFGASVFAFEPNIGLKKLWDELRPNTKVYYNGVSDKQDTLTLLVPSGEKEAFSNDVFATFQKSMSKLDNLKNEEIVQHEVEVGPLSQFLEWGQYDFLFIDTEGHEESVLMGIDFGKFKFKVVVLENNYVPGGDEKLRSMLKAHGYKLMMRTFARDDFYVATQ